MSKGSDINVGSIEDDVKIVKEFIDYAQEVIDDMEYERPVDVTVYQKDLTSMANILSEREQDKKYIKNLEIALKIINKVTDIDETKEENVVLLKEVLRKLEDISYGRG